jgi:hypothetical protein
LRVRCGIPENARDRTANPTLKLSRSTDISPADNFDDEDEALWRAIQTFPKDQHEPNSAQRDDSQIRAEQEREYGDAYNDTQQREFDARNEEIMQMKR